MRKAILWAAMCVMVGAAAVGFWVLFAQPFGRAPKAVSELFEWHGWVILGETAERPLILPPRSSLDNPPWKWELELSQAIGLDFSAFAGQEVTVFGFPVRDRGAKRLTQFRLEGNVLVHKEAGLIGAWLCAPEETPGEIKPGEFRCFDLDGGLGRSWQ